MLFEIIRAGRFYQVKAVGGDDLLVNGHAVSQIVLSDGDQLKCQDYEFKFNRSKARALTGWWTQGSQ
jgi:hypothetical protein